MAGTALLSSLQYMLLCPPEIGYLSCLDVGDIRH